MTGVVRKRRTTRTRIKKKRMESIGDEFFCSFVFFLCRRSVGVGEGTRQSGGRVKNG